MTPAARVQAAIDLLDLIIAAARDDGPAADTLIARYFRDRRYAGSVIVNESNGRYFEPAPGRTWMVGGDATYTF